MVRRARQAFLIVLLMLAPRVAGAQVIWQPTLPPLVTAENETWFRAVEPIEWSGDFYYPAGTPQFFNRYQMVRSGSYKGIPLYTDVTHEPYSIVLVPIGNERMQAYERRRVGMLAGTSGSTMSSFPTEVGAEGVNVPLTLMPQAAAPPVLTGAYDRAPAPDLMSAPRPTISPFEVAGTTGRTIVTRPRGPVETVRRPTGVNGIWIAYEGRRWYEAGKALEFAASDFTEVGSYRGWPVYARTNDRRTIYIATAPGHVAPYRVR